jgi:hypothetical protein
MKKFLTLLALVTITHFGFAQDSSAFKADIIRFLEISGATEPIRGIGEQIKMMIPEDRHEEFTKDFESTLPSLFSKIADIYMAEFTHDEIKQILAFYDSDLGKKVASKTGELMEKASVAGEQWGLDLQMIMSKYMEN